MANKNLKLEDKRKEKGERVTSWICYMWVALSCMFKSHLPQGQKFKYITCHLLRSLLDSNLRECMSFKRPTSNCIWSISTTENFDCTGSYNTW